LLRQGFFCFPKKRYCTLRTYLTPMLTPIRSATKQQPFLGSNPYSQ